MNNKIYAIFDSKAGTFLQPIFAQTHGVAKRMFHNAANDTDHDFHKYAADFTLFYLGDWDPETAKFDLLEAPKSLGNALTFIKITGAE